MMCLGYSAGISFLRIVQESYLARDLSQKVRGRPIAAATAWMYALFPCNDSSAAFTPQRAPVMHPLADFPLDAACRRVMELPGVHFLRELMLRERPSVVS